MTVAKQPLGSTPSPLGSPYLELPLGFESLSAANLAASYGLQAIPVGARYARISVQTAAVSWRDDGTAPTATIGMIQPAALTPFLYAGDLTAIRFILVSGSPIVNVSYYR
jgi:hypothetical protein